MKIIHIITQGENGGAQKNVLDIVSGLSINPVFEMHAAVGLKEKPSDTWLVDNLLSRGVKSANIYSLKSVVREISLIKDLRAMIALYRLFKHKRFDIVHLHSSKMGVIGSIAAKLAGCKTIFTVHGFYFTEPMSKNKKYTFIFIEWFASFFIDHYICVSKKDLELGKKYKIIRADKGVVVYNGIEEKSTKIPKEGSRENIFKTIKIKNENQKIVGTIANLYETKGLSYLIASAKIVLKKQPKTVFVIFGAGPIRKKLEMKIKELNLEDDFFLAGYTPEASTLINGFDLFVLPSLKEGLPYALLEASLTGVPIVATDVGGIPEIAHSLNIQIVRPSDSIELSEKIILLLEKGSESTYETKLPKEFFRENMLKKVSEIYLTI